jgi:hypothetical protein
LIEYVLGLHAEPARTRLIWNLWTTDEIGIDRYPFGAAGLLDLRAKARQAGERPQVEVRSNIELELELRWEGGSEIVKMPAQGSNGGSPNNAGS